MSHRIAFVHFLPGTSDGPLTCTCGAKMRASQFGQHRLGLGLKTPTIGVPEGHRSTFTTWKRSADKAPHPNTAKTHCAHGHEFTEANTCLYVSDTGTRRVCRACAAAKARARRLRQEVYA